MSLIWFRSRTFLDITLLSLHCLPFASNWGKKAQIPNQNMRNWGYSCHRCQTAILGKIISLYLQYEPNVRHGVFSVTSAFSKQRGGFSAAMASDTALRASPGRTWGDGCCCVFPVKQNTFFLLWPRAAPPSSPLSLSLPLWWCHRVQQLTGQLWVSSTGGWEEALHGAPSLTHRFTSSDGASSSVLKCTLRDYFSSILSYFYDSVLASTLFTRLILNLQYLCNEVANALMAYAVKYWADVFF